MSRFPRAVLSPGYIRSPILKYHWGKYGSVTWNTVPTILALYISCIMTDREKAEAALNLRLTHTNAVGNRSFNSKIGAAVAHHRLEDCCGPDLSSEVTMPYATGEIPEVGDYIKNQWEQPGTVTRVHFAQDEEERICVRWDDGGLELLFSPASEYTLVSRRSV